MCVTACVMCAGVDMSTTTIKMLSKELAAKYPGVDMASKKAFIRETVKEVLDAAKPGEPRLRGGLGDDDSLTAKKKTFLY